MYTITEDQLQKFIPSLKNPKDFIAPLNDAFSRYEINTPARVQMFMAQAAHETGGFKWLREIWGPTAAQKGYEGRKDLGNIHPGDGSKYRGRGIFQTTGRANYEEVGKSLGIDTISHPELLESIQYAALSAGLYWQKRGLNTPADSGDIKMVTKKINGGYNGLAERESYYNKAKNIFN